MKAIIIARVSTEEQKEAGLSLPAQEERLKKYCQNKGFEIIKSCSFDESAYKDQRDEFDAILDFILAQKDKVAVCCDKVDRLTRNVFDKRISALYERALSDQIELHFISDGQILNSQISAAQKFQFSISLGLAKYYSDVISDNVKRANEQKLRRGEWAAKAPFGYKNISLPPDWKKKDVIVDNELAPIINHAFELYASQAYSMELLYKKLKSDYGVNWSKGYIDKLLNNHFYYGIMVVKGKHYPHRYPPLISKELFDQVQSVKAGFNKKPIKYAGLPYAYRGLMRCGDCGLAITAEKHKGHVYYHCTQFNGKHGAKWFREEEITEQLANIFKLLKMPDNIVEEITNTLSEVHQNKMDFHNKQFDKLTKEQRDLTKMMDSLYMDKLRGRITEADYDRFYQSFCEQRDDINSRIGKLQQAENNYYITAKHILGITSKAHELFIGSEVEEKRQLIKLVLLNLRIEGENIEYIAQKPFDLILKCSDDQVWRP
ncbi:MAG: recombinase family protein [Candidatus Babeliaceae bacterium]|nr:recombinase family protein [Candidatus Babeliaceae bacterium]